MAVIEAEAVINAPVSKVAENLEAFLWADDARTGDPEHEPGTTTAVRKVTARQFEEDERVDLGFFEQTLTTKYTLSAAPGRKTKIVVNAEMPDFLVEAAAFLGADIQAEMNAGAVKWTQRFEAFLGKQVQRGTEGVA